MPKKNHKNEINGYFQKTDGDRFTSHNLRIYVRSNLAKLLMFVDTIYTFSCLFIHRFRCCKWNSFTRPAVKMTVSTIDILRVRYCCCRDCLTTAGFLYTLHNRSWRHQQNVNRAVEAWSKCTHIVFACVRLWVHYVISEIKHCMCCHNDLLFR